MDRRIGAPTANHVILLDWGFRVFNFELLRTF